MPGLTFIFGPKGITGRVLIPVPGLPTWIQGGGVEFPITADGKLVVDDTVKAKIKELLDKARAVPTDISRKLEELLAKTREAGEDIQDIYTDGDGNILADVIDSTGKVVRTITLPADVLLTDTKNEGLLEWILSSQIIAGAFGLLGKALGGKVPRIGEKEAEEETEEEVADEEKGTGVGVVGVDDEEESTDGPFSDVEEDTTTDETGIEEEVPGEGEEEERDRHDPERREPPEGQEGDGPVLGDDISSTGEEAGPDGVWTGDQYKREQDGEEPGPDDGGPVGPGPDGGDGSGDSDSSGESSTEEGPVGVPPSDDRDSSGGVVTSGTDDVQEDEPFTGGGGGMFSGLGGGGAGAGYMDNLGYGLSDFVPVQYQLKDYNVELNRLINDSLFRGIV